MANKGQLRTGHYNELWDNIFVNEINQAIELSYESYSKCVDPVLCSMMYAVKCIPDTSRTVIDLCTRKH